MKRPAIVIGAFVLTAVLLLALSGCEGYETYTPNARDLTRLESEYPDGPVKQTAEAIALERFGTAQAAQSQAEQLQLTSQAVEQQQRAAEEAAQRQYTMLTAEAQMTQEAHRREMEQRNQWATQQSANATEVAQATAQALAVAATSQALSIQATAEARSYEATATADALNRAATSTAEARNVAATATAQRKADVATATRQAWEAKTTATAECVQATAAAYSATATRAAEKREMTLGAARDFGIPLVLLILGTGMLAFIVYAIRQQAKRPIVYPRNVLGDAEPFAVPQKGGGYTFVDLDRQPGPALQVLPDGRVAAPLLRSAGQEERTTARDQLVDAMNRPKLGAGQKGGSGQTPTLPMMAPPAAPPTVRVLPPEQVRPWIEDVEVQLLEEVNE